MNFAAIVAEAGPGLILELGVAKGESLKEICFYANGRVVYGFDWFYGLPERFHDLGVGAFNCDGHTPKDLPANCALVVGLIENTVKTFLELRREPVALVHFDLDLYGPTKCALDALTYWVRPGTIFAFDEITGFPDCTENEQKAFWEWHMANEVSFRYLGRRHHTSWVLQIL